jgi:phosphotransferase system HPr-like phosphotransfer protein
LMSTGSSITPPSFNIPGSAVGAKAVSGIMGNITTNNNHVNVNAQGASADEVAAIVIRQLDMRSASNIGGAG